MSEVATDNWRTRRHHDLAGKRFGKLLVIGPAMADATHAGWEVQCDCGKRKNVRTNGLLNGSNKSCGCSNPRARFGNQLHLKHGKCYTREYFSWASMKARCLNPKDENYPDYGGRGITICERWLNSFENFYADMGPRPENTTLGRKDNNGNYEPGNCRWEDGKEQCRNKRNTLLLTAFGEIKAASAWLEDSRCKVLGPTLYWRIKHGWEAERAISTPNLK